MDIDALRTHYGEPHPLALAFVHDFLDEAHQQFISHSPLVCVATTAPDGSPRVSPKGDAPGFVTIVDERTLLVPDRPGNNKLQTLTAVAHDPRIALLFLVPGVREMLRVEGTAELSDDPELLELGRVNKRLPPSTMVVHVDRAYIHCGKAIIRSRVWDPATHLPKGTLPTLGEVMRKQRLVEEESAEVDAMVEAEYIENLY